MARRLALTSLVAALCAWAAAPAHAQLGEVYADYRQTGVVDGCERQPAELRAALQSIPADIQAYDPGFAEALNAALAQRGAGCGEEAVEHIPSGAAEADDGSPGPQPPLVAAAPAPSGQDEGSGPVAPILAVALAAGLLAVIALADPVWLRDVAFVLRRRLRG